MEITFLGTSSAVPSKLRNQSSIALKAFGEVFLFDCGEGTQRQLLNAKISPMKINQIFITHLHGDHILGLAGLIQSMGFRGRKNPLHIYGPIGIEKMKKAMLSFGYFIIEFPIIIHEIKNGIIVENSAYFIECIKTQHNIENFSYSFCEKKKPRFLREKAIELGVEIGPDFGKLHNGFEVEVGDKIIKPEQVLGEDRKGVKFIYSGDTKPCEAMVKLSKDANLLIHESTYKAEDEEKALKNAHSTSKQAATIAKKSNVDKLILTHVSTRYLETNDLKEEAIEIFKNTELAFDFMTIKL